MDADPLFADAGSGDYKLDSKSPCIDTGAPLTVAVSDGQGTRVTVEDALFFSDGYGIVEPDVVRIGYQKSKIVSVDYENHTITLIGSLSWRKGDPVSLDYDGNMPDIGLSVFHTVGGTGILDNGDEKPEEYALRQNHPNPFNPATTIEYRVPRQGLVTLKVLSITGQTVSILRDGIEGEGIHAVKWDASGMPSGIYYYTMNTDDYSQAKKMLLLK